METGPTSMWALQELQDPEGPPLPTGRRGPQVIFGHLVELLVHPSLSAFRVASVSSFQKKACIQKSLTRALCRGSVLAIWITSL